jgi:cell division protein FtsB
MSPTSYQTAPPRVAVERVYHQLTVCKATLERGTVALTMGILFLILILAGAVLALVAAVGAWRAYLRLRRARAALQNNLTEEVDRLSRRTGELEENLSALDARAQQLPVQIAELQQSLSTLRILTEALAATLRQAQRVLSYSALKTLSAGRIADLLRYRPAPKNDPRSG